MLSLASLLALSSGLVLTSATPTPQAAPANAGLDPYPGLGKPRLNFRPDGTFKLTVFSDLHFGENPWDDWGPRQDRNTLKLMNTILPSEKPDYV